jgi:hypothetical protein
MDNLELQQLRKVRWLTAFFIVGLAVSGATAMPLEAELNWLTGWLGASAQSGSSLLRWFDRARTALAETNARYPFMAYGYDWLAFGHFMIALAFCWAWREPIRCRWLYDFGLAACALVIPYALVLGSVRGIPLGWRLIDCSFGLVGALPLWLCRSYLRKMDHSSAASRV